ncbi:MAG: RNA-binding transcriptional accessory protein, partial [Planctomycetes bacterium]|nr:RNA-binding transcriptional accessory protein [Planctomycetota bacterium]
MSGNMPELDSIVAGRVAEWMNLEAPIVARVLELLGENKGIPYLARYRRVDTGAMDERTIRHVRDAAAEAREMEQRRAFILAAVSQREGVSEKYRKRIERCRDKTELEYLYEPYRPARNTPGRVARESGLAPLAEAYLANEAPDGSA